MREYIERFCMEYGYPKEARESILEGYNRLIEGGGECEEFHELVLRYKKGEELDYRGILKRFDAMAEEVGVHRYQLHLLFFICLSKFCHERYVEKGISEKIFYDTMCDLKWKLAECHRLWGVWGTCVGFWFPGFFELTRFAIGRLQYELIPFEADYEKDGIHVKKGDTVINVHIPSCGPLIREVYMKSYEKAAEFYHDTFPGDTAIFVCESWLLFPAHKEMLKAGSHILEFMNDYDIYDSGYYANHNDLWRIFYEKEHLPAEQLPRNTSLERAYADWLMRGNKTGWGQGVFIYHKHTK